MVIARRHGRTSIGCLLSLALFVLLVYVGINIGEVYWHYFALKDAMEQEARFAANTTDEAIRDALRARADSLGLPEQAQRLFIRRTARGITISTQYTERVKFPLFEHEFAFTPTVARRF